MKDLMEIFSNTKATIEKLELLAKMYNNGNINVHHYDTTDEIKVERNFVKMGHLENVFDDIVEIDFLILRNEYDKEIRVFVYKEMLKLKDKFLWAFLYLKGILKVGVRDKFFEEWGEMYRKELDMYKPMLEEAFRKEGIEIKQEIIIMEIVIKLNEQDLKDNLVINSINNLFKQNKAITTPQDWMAEQYGTITEEPKIYLLII